MIGLDELVEAAAKAPPKLRQNALLVLRGQAQLADPKGVALANEPYLTRKELAQRFKVSRITLWRWQVPSHDLGGHALFRFSEVKAYLQSEAFKRRAAALRAGRCSASPSAGCSTLAPSPIEPDEGESDADIDKWRCVICADRVRRERQNLRRLKRA